MGLSKSEIEEILRQDPEIVMVHWPKDWEFGIVNRSLWSENMQKREEHIHLLEEYLRRPCIEDTFEGNLLARKMWKGKWRDDQRWIYYKGQDSLRYGTMRVIPSFCEWFLDDYQGENRQQITEKTSAIRKIVPQTFQEYDKLSTQKKIGLVGVLKEHTHQLLTYFYAQNPAS